MLSFTLTESFQFCKFNLGNGNLPNPGSTMSYSGSVIGNYFFLVPCDIQYYIMCVYCCQTLCIICCLYDEFRALVYIFVNLLFNYKIITHNKISEFHELNSQIPDIIFRLLQNQVRL